MVLCSQVDTNEKLTKIVWSMTLILIDKFNILAWHWRHLEPEPVEDLNGGDDGEASEETHHAAHPGDLVWQRHLGVSLDLEWEMSIKQVNQIWSE